MDEKKLKELEMFDELKKLLCKDIKSVIAKGDITPPDYQALDTAVDIYKDAATICAMIEAEMNGAFEEGSSFAMGPDGMTFARGGNGGGNSGYMPYTHSYGPGGNSYGGGYSGQGGNSYARGRSQTTGRYMSRDDEMSAKLQNMMNMAQNEQERMTIQRVMNEMGV